MSNAYNEAYQHSIDHPEDFWAGAAEDVHWFRRWERVLDRSGAPFYRWFTGAVTNTCYNALDRHIERGRGEQAALIYDSPVTNTIKTFTYRELRDLVARFAGALQNLGVVKGDRVIIYMPMIPEAVVAMLACARIGAIHSVVFGGFAANELAKRIADAKPKVIVSASCGIEPNRVIPYKPMLDAGKPASTPDPCASCRVISQHGVSVLFTAPTAFRAIKRDDPIGYYIRKYDRKYFRYLFLAGERCDPDTLMWAQSQLHVPVIDHWWQTETGWPIGANCVGLGMLPVKPGSCSKPVPGYDVRILDERGEEVAAGAIGNVVIKLPLPPGCLPTMWNADDEYRKWYLSAFPGYYQTADAGFIDSDGYLWIMSRTDDIINVAGHRLSTGALEEVLASHPAVAECAVVGVADEIKGEVPVGLVVLKSGVKADERTLVDELIRLVRNKVGPVASFKSSVIVKRLPKTRSGKIVRGTIKRIAEGTPYTVPATIDDPATLDEIAADLATVGYPHTPANAKT